MMKPAAFIDLPTPPGPPRRRQRGDALIEALVGILLMAVIGLGLSYAAGRALNSQRYQSTQNLAITQMRSQLSTTPRIQDLCGVSSGKLFEDLNKIAGLTSIDLAVPTCVQASVSVAVAGNAGLNVTLPAGVVTSMRFSTQGTSDAASLFGGDGVITISQ